MIMILFGALSAGTKTYLLCRSDGHAFMSTFCNTLPVCCLKFCFSLEIRYIWFERVIKWNGINKAKIHSFG